MVHMVHRLHKCNKLHTLHTAHTRNMLHTHNMLHTCHAHNTHNTRNVLHTRNTAHTCNTRNTSHTRNTARKCARVQSAQHGAHVSFARLCDAPRRCVSHAVPSDAARDIACVRAVQWRLRGNTSPGGRGRRWTGKSTSTEGTRAIAVTTRCMRT